MVRREDDHVERREDGQVLRREDDHVERREDGQVLRRGMVMCCGGRMAMW